MKVTRLEERRQETAFLGKVGGLDEAVFDFELTKSKELDSSLTTGKERVSQNRRTRSFKTVVNARNAAKRWHEIHRAMGHPSRGATDAAINSGRFGYVPQCSEVDKFCEHCSKAPTGDLWLQVLQSHRRQTPVQGRRDGERTIAHDCGSGRPHLF